MILSDLIKTLEEIAPLRFAEAWDNVGLLVGDPAQAVSKVLLTIDYTAAVAAERHREGCDCVIAYHPPIFDAIKRLTRGGVIFDAIRDGVAIYSPHTAIDIAEGGTNDMLADVLGLKDRTPLRLTETKASQYKLVSFVPEEDLERVSAALFEAGAGRIGAYSRCSFRSAGTGTFFGEAGANPTVGQSGKFEQAAEVRLETVMPIGRVPAILAALRRSHPYEEPAFDLVQLAAAPEKPGQGRIGTMKSTERVELFARIKRELGLEHLLIAGPTEGPITSAACCAGSCGEMLNDALEKQAGLFLTGEMRHHDALKAAERGMTVVCTGHSNSERPVLQRLAARLRQKLPALQFIISRKDHDPFLIC
ncbi:MAG TPA: Nif3-like dinuclear metal center hexameric protein [Tepidisphaeraceae bacterium]|jgi:dinuclear metal center YbgI/SA1388 family protein